MWKRNRVFWASAAILIFLFNFKHSKADNTPGKPIKVSASDAGSRIYAGIDFGGAAPLSASVFTLAYEGYNRLLNAGKVVRPGILTVIDYSLSANAPRMWVLDLVARKVLYHTLVAHGQGTGEEYARDFSNRENSHQSSLGFFVTGATYQGQHGLSLYLHGMDAGFNDAAFSRAVVLHGAAYVSEAFIRANKRLGRSWGCPAVSAEIAPELIRLLQGGTCMFSYFPDKNYLIASRWLPGKEGFATAAQQLQLPVAGNVDAETKL